MPSHQRRARAQLSFLTDDWLLRQIASRVFHIACVVVNVAFSLVVLTL
jgi:hypothetical protein